MGPFSQKQAQARCCQASLHTLPPGEVECVICRTDFEYEQSSCRQGERLNRVGEKKAGRAGSRVSGQNGADAGPCQRPNTK